MSIINTLIPILDTIRGTVATIVGDHVYDFYLVSRQWSGNVVGAGTPTDTETKIVPSPRVNKTPERASSQQYTAQTYGRLDMSRIEVTEISLAYAETDLTHEPAPGEQVFYRLKDAQGNGLPDEDYVLTGPPVADREKTIGWILKLEKATEV